MQTPPPRPAELPRRRRPLPWRCAGIPPSPSCLACCFSCIAESRSLARLRSFPILRRCVLRLLPSAVLRPSSYAWIHQAPRRPCAALPERAAISLFLHLFSGSWRSVASWLFDARLSVSPSFCCSMHAPPLLSLLAGLLQIFLPESTKRQVF